MITAVPVKDTIKEADDGADTHHPLVIGTLDRKRLWAIQTPQTFAFDLILQAYQGAMEAHITATDDAASHSSPVAVTILGQRHALFFTRTGLVGVEPTTGHVRYTFPFRARINASVNAATPLVVNDRIFLSASYRTGAVLLRR